MTKCQYLRHDKRAVDLKITQKSQSSKPLRVHLEVLSKLDFIENLESLVWLHFIN